MQFNSYAFLLAFLPLVLLGFHVLAAGGRARAAQAWLLAASLFFYAWHEPRGLLVLAASLVLNGGIAAGLRRRRREGLPAGRLLAAGVALDLALLAYFKYARFLVENLVAVTGWPIEAPAPIAPLGISFLTFIQIAYLVDVARAPASGGHDQGGADPLRYALFVTFFPQIVAGPIVRRDETAPQLGAPRPALARDLAVGLTIFSIGLAKKVLLADAIAPYASGVFDAADAGASPSLLEAWGGAVAYSLQLYFDFSGYSDMAIGVARLFGVVMPLNFDAPYRAASLVDFWRRWHVTLSRFLRDYLYIGLGGNRRGTARRYANLFVTMLLGGIWHGASWNFAAWGALHGAGLIVNHGWRALRGDRTPSATGRLAATALTFAFVVVCWVPFRAATWEGTGRMLAGMAGLHGVVVPAQLASLAAGIDGLEVAYGRGIGSFSSSRGFLWIAALLSIAWIGPTTQRWMDRFEPALGVVPLRGQPRWRPALVVAVLLGLAAGPLLLAIGGVQEFVYGRF